jgi:hypothetical protein
MPRDLPQTFVTYPGIAFGDQFADFTIELFGLKGEDIPPDEIERLAQRQVGQVQYANAVSETLPMKAGLRFTATNHETGDHISVWAWRWRVFMDDSSLCLENLWQSQAGWIPYVLGIKYDNPEKMVADAHRFAPAFRLCNLIDAKFPITGRPATFKNKAEFLDAIEHAAGLLDGASLTQPNIAVLMEADERQIRLWCDKFEINWSEWKRERKAKTGQKQ